MNKAPVPTGHHVCFKPRGNRVAADMEAPLTPEELLLKAERTRLVLLAAREESALIRRAIRIILHYGYTMAEACREVGLARQNQLNRAIARIATRVQKEEVK